MLYATGCYAFRPTPLLRASKPGRPGQVVYNTGGDHDDRQIQERKALRTARESCGGEAEMIADVPHDRNQRLVTFRCPGH